MDFITRKFAYIYLKLTEWIVNIIVWVYAFCYKRKDKTRPIKSIGAYWYNPPDITGSDLRMGKWETFFKEDGIKFSNFHINSLQEIVKKVEKGSWTCKYFFFSKCLIRRLPQILKAHRFDVIWIDVSIS